MRTESAHGPAMATAGSKDTFRDFYEREFSSQVRRAGLILQSNEAAADVTQESFLAVWRRWDSLKEPGAYLNRCVMNGCRSAARRAHTGERLTGRLGPLLEHQPPGDALWDALGALDFNQRAPLVLRYYGQLSNIEIADALGWPTGSVGPRITKGLRTLRKALT